MLYDKLLGQLIWRQFQIDQSYGSSAKNKHDEAEECDKNFDFLKFAICDTEEWPHMNGFSSVTEVKPSNELQS